MKSQRKQIKERPLEAPIFREGQDDPATARLTSPEIMHQIRRSILLKLAKEMDKERCSCL